MFAPPPVQLSRAEIQARLGTQRNDFEGDDSLKRSKSVVSDPKVASLHGNDLRSPTSPKRPLRFIRGHRSDRVKVSAPITAPPKGPPPVPPGLRAELPRRESRDRDTPDALKSSFGENPRRAPVPPKRSLPPPVEPLYTPLPGALPAPNRPVPEVPAQYDGPPPIPAKSPRRLIMASGWSGGAVIPTQQPLQRETRSSAMIPSAQEDVLFETASDRPGHPPRSSTAPVLIAVQERNSIAKPIDDQDRRTRSAHASFAGADYGVAPYGRASARLSGVRGGKIDKLSGHRRHESTAASIRTAALDFDELKRLNQPTAAPRRATESDIHLIRSDASQEPQMPWKRRRKGETMSMLLDTGFFPAESLIYNKDNPNVAVMVNLPLISSNMNKDLPPTPGSIMPTPTEMYDPSAPKIRSPTWNPKMKDKRRHPLGQLSTTDAKANSAADENALVSPRNRLSAIPEYSHALDTPQSPISSGTTTPVATQIHLKGGSVLTVSPPELTAWQRTIYIQGQIKLPKPTIIPRKNSVASLEPFQEAIDQVYQDALNVPRRCSDDAVEEDVCDFFDDFGFDGVNFDGDLLAIRDTQLSDIKESDEDVVNEIERFSTPPGEPPASAVEKIMAKEIVETLPKPPPVENEATLRARGIARLKQNAGPTSPTLSSRRKDSMTLDSDMLPLLPLPEDSMLHAVLEPSRTATEGSRANSSGGKIEEVEELDSHSAWIAPATISGRASLNRDPSFKHSYNPLKRMQRLVATAGAIL